MLCNQDACDVRGLCCVMSLSQPSGAGGEGERDTQAGHTLNYSIHSVIHGTLLTIGMMILNEVAEHLVLLEMILILLLCL